MPFQSEKQRRYLWANEPEIAREWTDRYGARGGGIMRIPFQNAGLASLPYPEYYKLPPFSAGNTYTNAWTFPTDEELTTELSVSQDNLPASYRGYPSYEAWLAAQRGEGDAPGQGHLGLTYDPRAVAEGPASGTTDFNINPAAFLTGKGRLDPMGSDVDYFNALSGPERFNFGFQMSDVPGQEGYQAPSKYFEEPSLIDKGIGSIKDFFSGLGTPRVRGTLGTREKNKPRIPLPAAIASWSRSPFNKDSPNYNPMFEDQLNYLESSGGHGSYIGRDQGSGLLKYGPESVLAGQNVFSLFGSNNYENQLAKKRAWFEARKKAKKIYNEKKYQKTLDEITAWENSPKNPKNKNKPIGPAHTILGPDNPLIGKIDHTGGGGHGSITRAPGSKGPKGTPTHRTRDDLMAQGGLAGLWPR